MVQYYSVKIDIVKQSLVHGDTEIYLELYRKYASHFMMSLILIETEMPYGELQHKVWC